MDGRKTIFKVMLLGDVRCGKTAFLSRVIEDKIVSHYKPTIGADYLNKHILIDDVDVCLQLWDTAGREKLTPLDVMSHKFLDAYLLFYDVTRPETLDYLLHYLNRIKRMITANLQQRVFILVGNKTDLSKQRKVSKQDVETLRINIKRLFNLDEMPDHYQVSVKKEIGVEELVSQVASDLLTFIPVEDDYYVVPSQSSSADAQNESHYFKPICTALFLTTCFVALSIIFWPSIVALPLAALIILPIAAVALITIVTIMVSPNLKKVLRQLCYNENSDDMPINTKERDMAQRSELPVPAPAPLPPLVEKEAISQLKEELDGLMDVFIKETNELKDLEAGILTVGDVDSDPEEKSHEDSLGEFLYEKVAPYFVSANSFLKHVLANQKQAAKAEQLELHQLMQLGVNNFTSLTPREKRECLLRICVVCVALAHDMRVLINKYETELDNCMSIEMFKEMTLEFVVNTAGSIALDLPPSHSDHAKEFAAYRQELYALIGGADMQIQSFLALMRGHIEGAIRFVKENQPKLERDTANQEVEDGVLKRASKQTLFSPTTVVQEVAKEPVAPAPRRCTIL